MTVSLDCNARDYSPLGSIQVHSDNTDWDKYLNDNLELRYCIMKALIEKANDDRDNITISSRNNRYIDLFANFTSKKKNGDKNDLPIDSENTDDEKDMDSQDSDNLRQSKKEFPQECLNGIVGALSGEVVYDDLDKNILPKEFEIDLKDVTFKINLQIKSRMDSKDNSFFLITLLMHGNLSSHEKLVYNTNDNFFDFLLMDIFAEKLLQAIPKGFYRKYRRYEKNDSRLTGSIDISRHIKQNMGLDNGRIAYSYRENTVDNNFNRLILAAYKCLMTKYPDIADRKLNGNPEIYSFLKQLQLYTENEAVSVHKLIADNSRPIAHPYYTEYEAVRQVCLKILRDEGVSIFDADSGRISGFLFYLPDLWEIFLYQLIQKAIEPIEGCECNEQITFGFFEGNTSDNWLCKSIPDFVFHHGIKNKKVIDPFLILDAKFIPNWEKAMHSEYRKGSLSSVCGDDINKCLRDMVVLNTNAVGIIYPRISSSNDDEKNKKRRISQESGGSFYIMPMEIPDPEKMYPDYSSWRTAFDKNSAGFIDSINKLCNTLYKTYN